MKTIRLFSSLALVYLSALLPGCGGGAAVPNSGAGSISGRAIDAQGKPLPGAAVSLTPAGRALSEATQTTTTDVLGAFHLTNVAAGTYNLGVSATGPNGSIDVQVTVTV